MDVANAFLQTSVEAKSHCGLKKTAIRRHLIDQCYIDCMNKKF